MSDLLRALEILSSLSAVGSLYFAVVQRSPHTGTTVGWAVITGLAGVSFFLGDFAVAGWIAVGVSVIFIAAALLRSDFASDEQHVANEAAEETEETDEDMVYEDQAAEGHLEAAVEEGVSYAAEDVSYAEEGAEVEVAHVDESVLYWERFLAYLLRFVMIAGVAVVLIEANVEPSMTEWKYWGGGLGLLSLGTLMHFLGDDISFHVSSRLAEACSWSLMVHALQTFMGPKLPHNLEKWCNLVCSALIAILFFVAVWARPSRE